MSTNSDLISHVSRAFSLSPHSGRGQGAGLCFHLLRYSTRDAVLILLALAHGVLLLVFPSIILIAIGLWWNSNTIAHNFIHKPFFRPRKLNFTFSLYESVLLGIPQTIWRGRHLAHHADMNWRPRFTRQLIAEIALVLMLWIFLSSTSLKFFCFVYLPGYFLGLWLCFLQGHYEHAHGTISHYGWLYNFLFLNDGYHVEHHDNARTHWTQLCRQPNTTESRWPAVLRWIEHLPTVASFLGLLEHCVTRSNTLQRLVLSCHERAMQRLLAQTHSIRRVAIVGGGLFPRTAIVIQKLLPNAQITIIDANARHIEIAKHRVPRAKFVHRWFSARDDHSACAYEESGVDLLILPLAYIGDRNAVYQNPPATYVILHDWFWHRRGASAIVSFLLLKRMNLVQPNPSCITIKPEDSEETPRILHPSFQP